MFNLHKSLMSLVVFATPISFLGNDVTSEISSNDVDSMPIRIIIETPDNSIYPIFVVPQGKRYQVRNVYGVENWNGYFLTPFEQFYLGSIGSTGVPCFILDKDNGQSVRLTDETCYGHSYGYGNRPAMRGYTFEEGDSLSLDLLTIGGIQSMPSTVIFVVEEF